MKLHVKLPGMRCTEPIKPILLLFFVKPTVQEHLDKQVSGHFAKKGKGKRSRREARMVGDQIIISGIKYSYKSLDRLQDQISIYQNG